MPNPPKTTPQKKSSRSREAMADFNFTQDQLPEQKDKKLKAYHHLAWEAYKTLPFPTTQEEAWRRTDIRELNPPVYTLSDFTEEQRYKPPPRLLDPIIAGDGRAGQIVSGATEIYRCLIPELEEKGVIFTDFHTAEVEHPELLNEILGKIVSPDEDKFTALAAALGTDGIFLYVPEDVVIEQPLHSLYWGAGKNKAFINHLVVWVEDGARVTFVHESASPDDGCPQCLHNGIVEIYVGRKAHLNFVELQSWGKTVWSFTRERARVMGDGNLEWIFGGMGTHLTKNFSNIDLVEPGAVGRMSGFYFTTDEQHLDHDTEQNHLAENTTSDLLFKGALMDQSRSVWQGMIYVAPGADGTDGYQANRNLILSKGARADSIPGLEILADDVRCSHGATVGKIDEDQLFYLFSRGIPEKEAEQIIVMGFFAPIMERIPFEGVQTRFIDAIRKKMSQRSED